MYCNKFEILAQFSCFLAIVLSQSDSVTLIGTQIMCNNNSHIAIVIPENLEPLKLSILKKILFWLKLSCFLAIVLSQSDSVTLIMTRIMRNNKGHIAVIIP